MDKVKTIEELINLYKEAIEKYGSDEAGGYLDLIESDDYTAEVIAGDYFDEGDSSDAYLRNHNITDINNCPAEAKEVYMIMLNAERLAHESHLADSRVCMKLPELNCLKPSEHTTFKKLVEEIAECNQALEELKDYEKEFSRNWLSLSDDEVSLIRDDYKLKLNNVLGEIMDIAQVCASQLFVFEKLGLDVETMLIQFRIVAQAPDDLVFYTKKGCRYIYAVPTNSNATLTKTMNKIILSMGTIAQLGKFTGENGEQAIMDKGTSYDKYVYELFNIILNCFHLLFSMEGTYHTNIRTLFKNHVEKLVRKGYCGEEILL